MPAKEKASRQVVVFVTDWCPFCVQMKMHTWTDEKVLEAVKPYHGGKPAFITCNKPQNRYLVEEFGIEKYPMVVIMDEDHEVKKSAHNMDVETLVQFLEEFDD